MHFQYVVAPSALDVPVPATASPNDNKAELLRELINVQKEQLAYQRAAHEAHNGVARWQSFLARWQEDFPTVGAGCKNVLPLVERAFLNLLEEVSQRLAESSVDDLENEFSLGDFLDRYGMRLAQLGNVLNIMGPIADASRSSE